MQTNDQTQVYFDQVQVGDQLGTLRKGPITAAHLMRWSAAVENWHRIHYDHRFAVEHDKLPGVLVNGLFKHQVIIQLAKDWAGLNGWAWKTRVQFRAMDFAGSILDVWARVTEKTPLDTYGLVELEVGIKDEKGRDTTQGAALVALPFTNGKPVPYPFTPPPVDPWAKQR